MRRVALVPSWVLAAPVVGCPDDDDDAHDAHDEDDDGATADDDAGLGARAVGGGGP